MPPRKARVHGPYQHGRQWRLVVVDERGDRHAVAFADRGAAIEARDAELARLARPEGYTVRQAIDDYVEACRSRGLRPSSIASTRHRLRTLLQVDDTRSGGELEVLGAGRARQLVQAIGEPKGGPAGRVRSVDYQRGALAEAGTWARWLVAGRRLRRDPFEGLSIPGRRRRGKPQLTITEASRLAAHALAAGGAGDIGAIATLACVYLGCRASEVTDRVVRDLDQGGEILWVREAKTAAGNRHLWVPPTIRGLLVALTRDEHGRDRAPGARLFGDVDRDWLYRAVHRLCAEARVPEVCPQSLRGLHATLATEAGRTSEAVAASLGHESPVITTRHYVRTGTGARAAQRRAFGVLDGGLAAARGKAG